MWQARDEDGKVWEYSTKPYITNGDKWRGKNARILDTMCTVPNEHWRHSRVERPVPLTQADRMEQKLDLILKILQVEL